MGVLVVMVVVLFVLLGVICGVCSVYGVSSAISGTNSGSDVSGINCVNGLVVLVQFGESRHVLSASHHLQEVLSLPSSIVQYMPSPPRGLVPALQPCFRPHRTQIRPPEVCNRWSMSLQSPVENMSRGGEAATAPGGSRSELRYS